MMRFIKKLNVTTIAAVCLLALIFIVPGIAGAQKRSHSVFFEGTDYELHVYRIFGKISGKTLLLIGGIQGDEPGGFLSADHYADISLARGNLIVVPRANFRSIVLKRRKINDDMNRRFGDDRKRNYETKIVSILKKLIMESDGLLNLHDGTGFFSEKWEGPDRNPLRYGQSIIADSETYLDRKTGKAVQLGKMARSVAVQINRHIEDPRHHFHFNNHRTLEENTRHKEQRKSATFYALYTCGIPAFGIETSKSLPLELKVRHHNLAINAFMERFDIVPETPGINLDPPALRYLVIAINDTLPVVVNNQQILYVYAGDEIMISHIEANYERGLTADIVNYGSISDLRKKVTISKPTKIVVRRDYDPCGSVNIEVGQSREVVTMAKGGPVARPLRGIPSVDLYHVKINGVRRTFKNYEHVDVAREDTLEIVEVAVRSGDASLLTVNFKGFVGNSKNNTGEDRGYEIRVGKDLWKRYSLNKKGKIYQIVAQYNGDIIGKLYVDVKNPAYR